jgi:hypothetical protein
MFQLRSSTLVFKIGGILSGFISNILTRFQIFKKVNLTLLQTLEYTNLTKMTFQMIDVTRVYPKVSGLSR